jgi:hypothetical protein
MDYKYAIVKTIQEAEQLNEYIKAGYYNEVPGACFEKWTDIIPVKDGFALEIMPFMAERPAPEFIINGVIFVEDIDILV